MYGIHVAKKSKVLNVASKTMLDAIISDVETLQLNAAQIFTHGPRNKNRNNMDHAEIKKYCKKNNIYLVVHSSYMTQNIWCVDDENKDKSMSKKHLDHITDQLMACNQLGSRGLVVHLPCKSPEKILETMKIIEPVIQKFQVPLLLEIEARKPSENTYETPTKLNNLCQILSRGISNKSWGLCIDTAHVWSSKYDISSEKNTTRWFNKFLFHKKIKLVHFNGASNIFGVHKDVHEIAFSKQDKIWGSYVNDKKKSGAHVFIKQCIINNVPMICEINRGSQEDAEQLFNTIDHYISMNN